MHGWGFVGADITDSAIQWARRNRDANPGLAPLLEIRRVQRDEAAGNDAGEPWADHL
jgi:23S rRNA A1618 N6-methylase RlmF